MYIFLTILIVLAALFLVFIVVIQNSKGGGLAAGFASSNQIMGVRKTTDFLEKTTWWLAGIIAVLSIVSAHFLHTGKVNPETNMQKAIEQKAVLPQPKATASPNFGNEVQETAPAATENPAQPVEETPAEPATSAN
ncbi:preprotein translocase subunit SecG [Porphyromonas macacae]|uniref:Protein-export membrane protein SecG n=1 Tax=Porphyromonas macacae TaxID=28115 RepID=A0A379DH71_9PORP|nr:preprotein translocase subunit SecG [Porphyromonas macacae]SUB77729.1 preprotein translocase subunit SecG [Porphyromonas macacae]